MRRGSDTAAQKRSDLCDKLGESDRRTQSGEQEVCEEQLSRESEKQNQGDFKEVVLPKD